MIRFTASHFPLADLRRSSKTCVKRSDYRRRSRFAYVLADKERTEFQNEGSGEFQNETARLAKILKSRRNPGWRRSADRAGLHANSLLTGNFTGKNAISGFLGPISWQKVAVPHRFFAQFPTQINRETIS